MANNILIMYFRILNKFLLLILIILPQHHALVKASLLNQYDLNKFPKETLISGWDPLSDKGSKTKESASKKTIDALNKFKKMPVLKPYFKQARGYAIFPNIAKGGIGIGGARGKGEVFEKGKVIGSVTVTQVSLGFQLGGQAFSQIIFFKDKKALDRFTLSNFEFGASASAALISEGANASADYNDGVAVLTFSKGGLMYEASIGGQKFNYRSY